MTTIAWDGETLAADSQLTGGDFVYQQNDKKIFNVNGHLVAMAGDDGQCWQFLDWYRNPDQDYPDKLDDMGALAITKRGAFEYGSCKIPTKIKPPFAIGTGSAFAMGAMLHGASAAEAVDIACKLDKYSSKPIKTARLR